VKRSIAGKRSKNNGPCFKPWLFAVAWYAAASRNCGQGCGRAPGLRRASLRVGLYYLRSDNGAMPQFSFRGFGEGDPEEGGGGRISWPRRSGLTPLVQLTGWASQSPADWEGVAYGLGGKLPPPIHPGGLGACHPSRGAMISVGMAPRSWRNDAPCRSPPGPRGPLPLPPAQAYPGPVATTSLDRRGVSGTGRPSIL